jgi:Amt family ammonium transporter
MLLGSQIVVVIIEICWAIGTSFFLFMALKLLGVLRVKPEDEEVGLDNSKHGGQSFGELGERRLGARRAALRSSASGA